MTKNWFVSKYSFFRYCPMRFEICLNIEVYFTDLDIIKQTNSNAHSTKQSPSATLFVSCCVSQTETSAYICRFLTTDEANATLYRFNTTLYRYILT